MACRNIFPKALLTGSIDDKDVVSRLEKIIESLNMARIARPHQNGSFPEIERANCRRIDSDLHGNLKIAHHIFRPAEDHTEAPVRCISLRTRLHQPLQPSNLHSEPEQSVKALSENNVAELISAHLG